MSPDSMRKADELVRLLGALGEAQEHGDDPSAISELTDRASVAHADLTAELA